ncbi:MAG TPA: hypothetical protein ENL03_02560, partial [Phycisphaerae bacterium]|nr:hypothetical protein [Phycisphaerae bacterium]
MLIAQEEQILGAVDSVVSERTIRRVAFFRRAGLFSMGKKCFQISRALSVDDLWQAYSLVHDCYLARGYIDTMPGGARIRPFEAMPEMVTLVATTDGVVNADTGVLTDS